MFFPDLIFGWAFLACLAIIMITASYSDLRLMVIPKALSLAALGLGIAFNVARGAWLGHLGEKVWFISGPTATIGALDGLLFALGGFFFGFALFFLLWILGVAGGGDVKLFAALGAWIGPLLTLYVLLTTLVILFAVIFAQAMMAVFSGKLRQKRVNPKGPIKKRLITFALPLTIAAGLVLFWKLKEELQLVPPKPAAALSQGDCRAIS